MSAVTEKRTIVCVGLAKTKGSKKLSPEFREVVDGAIVDRVLIWEAVKGAPGHVYEIEVKIWTDDQRVVLVPKGGRLRWLHFWPDQEERAKWEAEADAEKADREADRLRENAEKHSELKQLVEPLSRIYHKLPWGARTAFMLNVHRLILRAMVD